MIQEMVMLKDFAEEKFDIIIQGGQSNAQGFGSGEVETPYSENADTVQMTVFEPGRYVIGTAREIVSGNDVLSQFALPFCALYKKDGRLAEGRKLLIIRAAVGGTGFLDNRWTPAGDLYLEMLSMIKTALSLHHENRLTAFLWHQGETDALLKSSFETHYNHLKLLTASVREAFNVPGLPFIAGNFSEEWRTHPDRAVICEPVIRAIKAITQDIENAAFVDTDGLASNHQIKRNGDTAHFSRGSLYTMGERYYRAFCKIIEKDGSQ